MKMNYETERLLMKILPDTAAGQTLQFYQDNREVFEQYEADRSQNFYTLSYQKALLHCEYNLAIKQSAARFWVYEKTCPERIIGTVSLQDIRRGFYQSCGLGYKFDQRVWRRGYAKESIAQCIWIAFREMNLHRIEAQTLPENEASRKLLEGLGFAWEGTKRQGVKLHGTWRDHEVYALLAEEANLLLGWL
ncbi:MAG: GNAT family N-acetyltransferase [Lachnospiraceae bacterium]|nr:GNAT family N-acetyltransferase [Lachnospiraceae bacterium]